MSGTKQYTSLPFKPIGHNEPCILNLTAGMTGKCTEVC